MIDSAISPQVTPSRNCRGVGCTRSNLTIEVSAFRLRTLTGFGALKEVGPSLAAATRSDSRSLPEELPGDQGSDREPSAQHEPERGRRTGNESNPCGPGGQNFFVRRRRGRLAIPTQLFSRSQEDTSSTPQNGLLA